MAVVAETVVPPIGRAMAYGGLAALIWGAWPVVSRFGVQQTLTAYDITALRFAVAGVVLSPLVWRRGFGNVGWPGALTLATGAGVPYVLITVSGLALAPAGHAGVIVPSCMLTLSMIGGWLWLGDRPGRVRLIGIAVILSGVALTGWRGLAGGGDLAWIGDLMFVGSGLLWATYTVASRRWSVDPLHATALVSVLSMVLYLPIYLLFFDPRIFEAPATEVVAQAGFQGLFAGTLALLFYTRAVAILGAARGALFAALVPGVAVLLAFPLLGERPSGFEMLGVVIVTAGMILALGLFQRPRGAG